MGGPVPAARRLWRRLGGGAVVIVDGRQGAGQKSFAGSDFGVLEDFVAGLARDGRHELEDGFLRDGIKGGLDVGLDEVQPWQRTGKLASKLLEPLVDVAHRKEGGAEVRRVEVLLKSLSVIRLPLKCTLN